MGTINSGQRRHTTMNRRKKIKQLLEAHAKKANAKLAPKNNKPKYISKADRAKLEAEAAQEPFASSE
jgi:ribosomal protein L14E/L6E/L27E